MCCLDGKGQQEIPEYCEMHCVVTTISIFQKIVLFKYKILKTNAFDYFIKITNFENEEIQFLYANTKF